MSKKRILVVDDEASFTRMLKLNLEQTQRFEVTAVNWPEDAIATARQWQPHLVLMDIFMPRMSGGDVAAQIRADPNLKDTPIIFITAAVQKSRVADHNGVIGGTPFIAKPASFEDVLKAIDQYLPA